MLWPEPNCNNDRSERKSFEKHRFECSYAGYPILGYFTGICFLNEANLYFSKDLVLIMQGDDAYGS
jgi:hypothetical protein